MYKMKGYLMETIKKYIIATVMVSVLVPSGQICAASNAGNEEEVKEVYDSSKYGVLPADPIVAPASVAALAPLAAFCIEKEVNLEHVSNYIGAHVFTAEYSFQEDLRKSDLGIKKILEHTEGGKAEKFFINGWGQIVGACVALSRHKISAELGEIVNQNIDAAIEKGDKKLNPFADVNVREQAKNMMMYPHQGKYLPWKKANITEPISILNNLLKKYPARFCLVDGKCYLNIGQVSEDTIFTELWATGFAPLLEQQNYCGLSANREHPHITLINSNVIAAVKDKFGEKYGVDGDTQFKSFMESLMDEANKKFEKEDNPIEFTQFDSSYSEDYSPFEEVVVARLQAPSVKRILKMLASKVREEVDYTIAVKEEDSYHLTVATKYRKPNDFSSVAWEQIMSSCPQRSKVFSKFLEEFRK